jgi:hypothetical protein
MEALEANAQQRLRVRRAQRATRCLESKVLETAGRGMSRQFYCLRPARQDSAPIDDAGAADRP